MWIVCSYEEKYLYCVWLFLLTESSRCHSLYWFSLFLVIAWVCMRQEPLNMVIWYYNIICYVALMSNTCTHTLTCDDIWCDVNAVLVLHLFMYMYHMMFFLCSFVFVPCHLRGILYVCVCVLHALTLCHLVLACCRLVLASCHCDLW